MENSDRNDVTYIGIASAVNPNTGIPVTEVKVSIRKITNTRHQTSVVISTYSFFMSIAITNINDILKDLEHPLKEFRFEALSALIALCDYYTNARTGITTDGSCNIFSNIEIEQIIEEEVENTIDTVAEAFGNIGYW